MVWLVLGVLLVLFVVFALFTAIASAVLWAFGVKGMVLLKMGSAIGGACTAATIGAAAVSGYVGKGKRIEVKSA